MGAGLPRSSRAAFERDSEAMGARAPSGGRNAHRAAAFGGCHPARRMIMMAGNG